MSEVMVPLKDLFKEAMKKNAFRTKSSSKKSSWLSDRKRTGFKNTVRINCPSCRQKFMYQYVIYYADGSKKAYCSVDILKLKKKILDLGLDWEMVDRKEAIKTAQESKLNLNDIL